MPNTIELKENRAHLWERMKELNNAAETENRGLTVEEQANWDKANADIDELDKRIERQERLERAPAQRDPENVPKLTAEVMRNPDALRSTAEYSAAYRRWLCGMEEPEDKALMRPAYRALGTNVATAGGFAVPETMQSGIERALLEFGGMREVATIRSTSDGGDLIFLTSDDTSNSGEILAENTVLSEQDATIGATILKSYMYSSKMIRVSYQLIQDSAFDVEGYIAGILGERIGRATNAHFTTGTGANQPSGIAADATTGVSGATGQTLTCTWDDLISLEHSVGPAYRRNGRFMFSDATLQMLRKLKDGEGRYLWQPGQAIGGFPSTIMGYPYTINDDVADMAASAVSIFFGQLSKYMIRDVKGFTLVRFNERYGDYLQVGFTGFSRHDGGLIDAGQHPVKTYVNAAS